MGAEAGDLRDAGGDLRPGDFSRGSLSLTDDDDDDDDDEVEVELVEDDDFDEADAVAVAAERDLGSGEERTCLANPGRGSDMGSEDEEDEAELRRWESRTGPGPAGVSLRFSGRSSKSGVPGRLPDPPPPPSSPLSCSPPSLPPTLPSSFPRRFW